MARKKRSNTKRPPVDFIESVGELLKDVTELGYTPTLVGGMALVTLGSPRVTKDFDFLIGKGAREHKELIQVFYERGFELVSKIDTLGNVVATIDNEGVACARLRIDQPDSAYFYNHTLGLRVDLLFDFPIPARDAFASSTRKKIQSYPFHIASKEDLIKMKEIAAGDRRVSSDQQDLEFLRSL